MDTYIISHLRELVKNQNDTSNIDWLSHINTHQDEFKNHINDADGQGYTLLHNAVKYQNFSLIRLLLQSNSEVNSQSMDYETPLHILCTSPITSNSTIQNEIFELLIQAGAKLDCRGGQYEDTPLHRACRNANIPLIKLILEYQQSTETINSSSIINNPLVHIRDSWDRQPLHVTIEDAKGDNDNDIFIIIQLLIQYGARAMEHGFAGFTPLHNLALSNFGSLFSYDCINTIVDDVIKFLVDNGANVNAIADNDDDTNDEESSSTVPKKGRRPLHVYIMHGGRSVPVFKALLRANADPNVIDNDLRTPLDKLLDQSRGGKDISSRPELLAIHNSLLKYGAKDWRTPLDIAISNSNIDEVKLLIEQDPHCINPVRTSNKHLSPLYTAIDSKQSEIAQLLVLHEANITEPYYSHNNNKIISHIIQIGLPSVLATILQMGKLNIQELIDSELPTVTKNDIQNIIEKISYIPFSLDNYVPGETLLHYACDRSIGEYDLDGDEDENTNDTTSLSSSKDIFEFLLTYKDIDSLSTGKTAAYIVQTLIAGGISVNVRDRFGKTPLHKSVGYFNPYISKVLLDSNAILHSCSLDGTSPLSTLANFGIHYHEILLHYPPNFVPKGQWITNDDEDYINLHKKKLSLIESYVKGITCGKYDLLTVMLSNQFTLYDKAELIEQLLCWCCINSSRSINDFQQDDDEDEVDTINVIDEFPGEQEKISVVTKDTSVSIMETDFSTIQSIITSFSSTLPTDTSLPTVSDISSSLQSPKSYPLYYATVGKKLRKQTNIHRFAPIYGIDHYGRLCKPSNMTENEMMNLHPGTKSLCELLAKKANTENLSWPLHDAAIRNDTEMLRTLLYKNSKYVFEQDPCGRTALFYAIIADAVEATELLLDKIDEVINTSPLLRGTGLESYKNSNYCTNFHITSRVRFLRGTMRKNNSLLVIAAAAGSMNVLTRLLEFHHPERLSIESNNISITSSASVEDEVEEYSLNFSSSNNYPSPIYTAILCNNKSCLELLLKHQVTEKPYLLPLSSSHISLDDITEQNSLLRESSYFLAIRTNKAQCLSLLFAYVYNPSMNISTEKLDEYGKQFSQYCELYPKLPLGRTILHAATGSICEVLWNNVNIGHPWLRFGSLSTLFLKLDDFGASIFHYNSIRGNNEIFNYYNENKNIISSTFHYKNLKDTKYRTVFHYALCGQHITFNSLTKLLEWCGIDILYALDKDNVSCIHLLQHCTD